MIDADSLRAILPNCKDPVTWAEELSIELPQYNITTAEEISSFIAQTGHESAHYNILVENLNYSKDGLRKIFGKYFPTDQLAMQYAKNPPMIASRVYANRMGNGDEASREGWKYRGRGLIQCTGKRNYQSCSQFLFQDDRLLDEPDYLTEYKYAILSACWYWTVNKLNNYASDVKATTKLVNGGYHGLDDRSAIYERAMACLVDTDL